MKTYKIYTDTKYVKRHFLTTLDKKYLNKYDKEFLLQSFEILENHINKISKYSLIEQIKQV
tara:strand:+ start:592 stop:774 length:183 start_codon:yes stop_codon:yes gene_type:complete